MSVAPLSTVVDRGARAAAEDAKGRLRARHHGDAQQEPEHPTAAHRRRHRHATGRSARRRDAVQGRRR